jgi:hypothetical protein
MLASAIFTVFGLTTFFWLMFTLAVYALPFWIGLVSGLWVHGAGHGVFLAVGAGFFSGGLTLVAGQLAFDRVRSVPGRLAIALVYAVPAGFAGFHGARGFATFGGMDGVAAIVVGGFGACLVAGTAWARITGRSGAHRVTEVDAPAGSVTADR